MHSSPILPLHAEFLLLAHEPESGKKLLDGQHLKAGLAGAALLELNLEEALAIEGAGQQARLRATGADVDPELVEVVARADGQSPKKAVARIGGAETFKDRAGDLRDATWHRLENAGLVRSEEDKVMGLFSTTRRVQTTTARSGAVETLRSALTGVDQPDIRTAGLVAVTQATGLLSEAHARARQEAGGRARQGDRRERLGWRRGLEGHQRRPGGPHGRGDRARRRDLGRLTPSGRRDADDVAVARAPGEDPLDEHDDLVLGCRTCVPSGSLTWASAAALESMSATAVTGVASSSTLPPRELSTTSTRLV